MTSYQFLFHLMKKKLWEETTNRKILVHNKKIGGIKTKQLVGQHISYPFILLTVINDIPVIISCFYTYFMNVCELFRAQSTFKVTNTEELQITRITCMPFGHYTNISVREINNNNFSENHFVSLLPRKFL